MLKLISMDYDSNKKKSLFKDKLIAFLKENFSKKNNINRLVFATIGILICLIPAIVCNVLIRVDKWNGYPPVCNSGMAFSATISTSWMYFLRIVIAIILLGSILFTKEWYYIIFLSMAFAGGLFNLIDGMVWHRSISGLNFGVLDYIDTSWLFKNNVANWPDYSIIIGIFGFVLIFIIVNIYLAFRNRKIVQDKQDAV